MHLLNLVGKMCKNEMDPVSIVEHTEQTEFHPQMDGRTSMQSFILFRKLAAMQF